MRVFISLSLGLCVYGCDVYQTDLYYSADFFQTRTKILPNGNVFVFKRFKNNNFPALTPSSENTKTSKNTAKTTSYSSAAAEISSSSSGNFYPEGHFLLSARVNPLHSDEVSLSVSR